MSLLPPRMALPLDKFHWDAETRSLTAEASSFGPAREGTPWIYSIYDDACDEGIAIQSHKTHKIAHFWLMETEKGDGEIRAWHFQPVVSTFRVQRVTILND